MKTITFIKKAITCAFIAVAISTQAQTTHTVNNDAAAQANFTSLQAAVDAATAGDIIYVQPSATSYGDVTINKTLTLVGRSHSKSAFVSKVNTILLDTGASNSTIKGFEVSSIYPVSTVSTGTLTNVTITENKVTSSISLTGNFSAFTNIVITGNVIAALQLNNITNSIVTNNFFTGNGVIYLTEQVIFDQNIFNYTGNSIFNYNSSTTLTFSNSIFITNGIGDMSIQSNFQANNCLTYDYGGGTITLTNSGSYTVATINNSLLNTNPMFTNIDATNLQGILSSSWKPELEDFTLQASSPAKTAGSGGGELGVYQGYNFKPFGVPQGVPSIVIDTYTTTVPKNSNLNITITAKSN